VVGDVLRISPGDVIPVDGVLLSGEASLNEAILSGESRPVSKNMGDVLYAGSHNIVSPIVMRITALGQGTRIAGIASLLDKALLAKPQVVGLAEKWAGYFVVFLMAAAGLTAIAWYFLDPLKAWETAVAVLVASCPCALSLATPAAMAAAQGFCGVLDGCCWTYCDCLVFLRPTQSLGNCGCSVGRKLPLCFIVSYSCGDGGSSRCYYKIRFVGGERPCDGDLGQGNRFGD